MSHEPHIEFKYQGFDIELYIEVIKHLQNIIRVIEGKMKNFIRVLTVNMNNELMFDQLSAAYFL